MKGDLSLFWHIMDQHFSNSNVIDISTMPQGLSFSFYSNREIDEISNVEVICPIFFDNKGFSLIGGLCDSRMGVTSKKETCLFCRGNYISCPGHFGHINFILPVENPFLKNIFLKIIRSKCWYCNFFKISNWRTRLFYSNFLQLDSKILNNFFTIDNPIFYEEKKKLAKNVKKITRYFFGYKNIKNQIETTKNFWELENFPKVSYIEKSQRNNFWCFYLNFFFNTCIQNKLCQKCKKTKVFPKTSLDFFVIVNKKLNSIRKTFLIHQKNFSDPIEKNIELCGENVSKIYCSNINRLNTKIFQVKKQIDNLWKIEKDFCELIWGSLGTSRRFQKKQKSELFFLSSLLVPPTRFRPVYFSKIIEKSSKIEINPQNYFLMKALKLNQRLLLASSFSFCFKRNFYSHSLGELEQIILSLFANSSESSRGKKLPFGIKQKLEKKFGLFRMYLVGKRVFHSARSIIVPDPFLAGFEIGIPFEFAVKLNASTTINCFNFSGFQILDSENNSKDIKKGNNNLVETCFGKKHLLGTRKKYQNFFLLIKTCQKYKEYVLKQKFKSYGINRKKNILREKNLILLNRQPSLHRASVMSHSVKILNKIKCIKIHYSNCNSYNADFDGDEMNVHFPQNFLARSESLILSSVYNHNKVPTTKMLIRGLIQDNIVISVFLTQKNTFLNESLFFHALSIILEREENLNFFFCPAIIKPRILWTGKQLISIFLKTFLKKSWSITLESRTKVTKSFFGKDETKILIRHGEFLRGILDSSQIGNNKHGLFHAFNEIYGSFTADKLLSTLCKILIFYQRTQGFTSGIEDLLLNEYIEKNRIQSFRKERNISILALRKIFSNNGIFAKIFTEKIYCFNKKSKIIGFLYSNRKLFELFIRKSKNILVGVLSNGIESTILGGLEKTFQCNTFLRMTLTGAKGSSLNIFQICSSLGQTELEGEFIPSGYGGKTLPNFPPLDYAYSANGFIFERFLTGIPQPEFFFHCIAGREGLLDTSIKTSQSGYVQRSLIKHLESVKINEDSTVRFGNGSIAQFFYSADGLNSYSLDFDYYLPWFSQNFKKKKRGKILFSIISKVDFSLDFKKKKIKNELYKKFFFKNRISIAGEKLLKGILESLKMFNTFRKHRYSFWGIFLEEKALANLYQKNKGESGEPIGVITGQSLGEPCTQMTLDNFHFAGKMGYKYNSGIFRLREILLSASRYPGNPSMSGYFKKNIGPKSFFSVEKRFKQILFYDVIETIYSFVHRKKKFHTLKLRIRVTPKKYYKHVLGLKKLEVIKKIKSFWKKIKTPIFQKRFFLKYSNIMTNTSLKSRQGIFLKKIKKGTSFFPKFFISNKRHCYKYFCGINYLKLGKLDMIHFGNKTLGLEDCVRNIYSIKNGFIDYGEKSVHTEGVNFYFFWNNNDLIDVKRIFTNDIFAMMIVYGIEAGRETLFQELMSIFEIQTIFVNRQHFDLVSDYMMRLGYFRPFGRRGVFEENFFQKITYETAVKFLIESSVNHSVDFFSSTSGTIGFGKTNRLGTGGFDIFFERKKTV